MIDQPEMSGMDDDDWAWRCAVAELNGDPMPCPECTGMGQQTKQKARGYGYEHVACADCNGSGLQAVIEVN